MLDQYPPSDDWRPIHRQPPFPSRPQGKYDAAEPLYKRALAIFEKALGPDHPNLATSLENYAALLKATQRTAEAEPLLKRAEAIRKAAPK